MRDFEQALNLFKQALFVSLIFFFGQGTRVEQGFEFAKVLRFGWFGIRGGPPEQFHILGI